MRGDRAIHTWRNAYAELTERVSGNDGMGDGGVYKVLKYSFDRLNGNRHCQGSEFNTLQHCFLHCALYPEDSEINREHLVSDFISGGLVDERKTRSLQFDQGRSILDKLVNLCLLESCIVRFAFGHTAECVKMHDLVRSMALKICEGKYMVRAGDESLKDIPKEAEWTKDLEKVSFMNSGIMRIGEGMSPDCPKLSTLLLCRNHRLEFIPDSFFSKMQGLCTLDLSSTNITMLPNSICSMKSLKVLLLEWCLILENVPYLGEMTELRELNLSKTAIKEVPQGVGELFNLKFLAMDAPELEMLPEGLFLKLGKLQHLELPIHMAVKVEEIANLELLEEFSGRLGDVNDFNSLITSWGSRVQDSCYIILVGSFRKDIFNIKRGNCKELYLSECNLKDEVVLAEGIKQLTISRCEGLSICFVDGLEGLKIEYCGGIEYILKNCQMATLKEIKLVGLDDMKGLIEKGEIGASAALAQPVFSSLTKLTIDKCNKMRIPLSGVPNIVHIYISKCEEIEEIFETSSLTLPKLKTLRLDELPNLRKVGILLSGVPNIQVISVKKCGEIEEIFGDEGSSSLTLPELKQLDLQQLPKLKSLCKGTTATICNSIEAIFIKECPRLMNKLPVLVDLTVPRRCQITVNTELWESLESDDPNLSLFSISDDFFM